MSDVINDRYRKRLLLIPAPGNGCHVSLLGVANLGVMAGLTQEQIFSDIRQAIPHGKRKVPNKEIMEAIDRAAKDFSLGASPGPLTPKPEPLVENGKDALQRIIDQAQTADEGDIWEASPIRITWPPEEDPLYFFSFLYAPEDLIWCGEREEPGLVGVNIKAAAEWTEYFKNGGKPFPHYIVNPLTGQPAPKKNGDGETFRGDFNVRFFRYCAAEFDDLPREDQIRFWAAAKLPIRALVDTGGKSIHALLDVQQLAKVETGGQWDERIRDYLYARLLTPIGMDSACSNPARLSRLPGHFRDEKGKFQRLLWLSSEGRRVFQ